MTTNGGRAYLLRNDGPTGKAIAIKLRSQGGNKRAIGALVSVTSRERTQTQMVRTGSSYLSHSPLELTFGVGQVERVERIEIRWPDGTQESIEDVATSQRYQITQGEGVVHTTSFSHL